MSQIMVKCIKVGQGGAWWNQPSHGATLDGSVSSRIWELTQLNLKVQELPVLINRHTLFEFLKPVKDHDDFGSWSFLCGFILTCHALFYHKETPAVRADVPWIYNIRRSN